MQLPPNPTLSDVLRLQKEINLQYCYIRYKGFLRPVSRKYFYTNKTLFSTFAKVGRTEGTVNSIEFPNDIQPFTDEEISTAWKEGRIVL